MNTELLTYLLIDLQDVFYDTTAVEAVEAEIVGTTPAGAPIMIVIDSDGAPMMIEVG